LEPLLLACERADIPRHDALERVALALWERLTPKQHAEFLASDGVRSVLAADQVRVLGLPE
jgi:hypothetical protein